MSPIPKGAIAVKKIDKLQNKRISRIEKKLGKVEKKWSIFSNFNATDGVLIDAVATATPRQFTFISAGDDPNDRAGNRVTVTRIKYRAHLSSAVDGPQQYRFVAFYWNSDTAPTLADVLAPIGAAAGVPNPILMPVNPIQVTAGYLVVLADRFIQVEGDTLASGTRLHTIAFNKRYKIGKDQFYSDTSGGDMKKGFYYLLCGTTGGVGTTSVQDSALSYYTDM